MRGLGGSALPVALLLLGAVAGEAGCQLRIRFGARVGTNYNRVEGLPVTFGPGMELAGASSLRVDALGIWRSETGFDLSDDDLGYLFRVQGSFLARGALSLGVTLHSSIEPVERWGLSDLESSLTTLLFHEDFRDYYERTGWSAFATIQPPGRAFSLTVDFTDEGHGRVSNGSPLTLKDNEDPWRPQPAVAQGDTRSLGVEVQADLRDDQDDLSRGWRLRARGRLGVGGDLTLPGLLQEADDPDQDFEVLREARPADETFAVGFLDLRRYNRLGPTSELHLRGVLAGSLDGDPLPPQYQHALGGEGSLPGYLLFQADCGARRTPAFVPSDRGEAPEPTPAFAHYGCDGIALFQAEFRSSFFFGLDLGQEEDWSWWLPHLALRPTWAAFLDVGRGWSLEDPSGSTAVERFDSDTLVDMGLGFRLGGLGFYLAVPLAEGADGGANFFVRLHHRF